MQVPEAVGAVDAGRRERIRSRLSRFGPGPVGWFTDICKLLDQDLPLVSAGMLVSHLFRELESAVREVLLPDEVRRTPQKDIPKGGKHLFQVNGILGSLGIDPDSHAGALWLGEAKNLHAYAHRSRMDLYALDAPTRERLVAFEDMLEVVLDAFEARYLTVIERLEALAAKTSPNQGDVDLLRKTFPQDFLTQERFFSLLGSAAWLPHLAEAGLFSAPAEPEADDEAGTVTFPAWPASAYLVRVAGAAPDEVLRVAEAIPSTANPRINLNLVEVALLLPPDGAVRLAPRIAEAARSSYLIAPERYAQLAVQLARGGHRDQAVAVMEALLAAATGRARTGIDAYELSELLQEHNAALAEHAGLTWLQALAAALSSAVDADAPQRSTGAVPEAPGEPGTPSLVFREDISSVWFRDLEANGPRHATDTRELLSEAVRDTARTLAATDLTGVLDVLDAYPWLIFRRLRLYVLEHSATAAALPVVETLADPVWADTGGASREWLRLARAHATALTPPDLGRVLAVIDAGPDTERLQRLTGQEPGPESAALVEKWQDLWRRDRYAALAAVLPEAPNLRLQELSERLGPAQSLDEPASSRMVWRGDNDGGGEDLAGKNAADLVDHAQQWKPSLTTFGNDAADFALRLRAAVTSDAVRYQADAQLFANLSDEHLAAVVEGFTRAVEERQPADCPPLVQLTTQILPRAHSDGSHQLHCALARLWLAVLAYTGAGIPTSCGDELFDILSTLARIPAPLPTGTSPAGDSASRWSQAREASVRALILWASWQKDRDGDTAASFALLDEQLIAARQPDSAAAHPVGTALGAYIGRLTTLNPEWARSQITALFDTGTTLGRAAWNAHLNSSHLEQASVGLLMDTYRAQARTAPDSDNRRQDLHRRLGEHLLALYLAGMITLDGPDTILTDYFARCSADTAADLASSVARTLRSGDDLPPQTLQLIQRWWTWRLEAAASTPPPAAATGRRKDDVVALLGPLLTSDAFTLAWRLEQLQAAFAAQGDLGSDQRVFSFLAELAETDPGPALDLLAAWVPTLDQHTWVPQARESEIRLVLLAGRRSVPHRDFAGEIINRFAYCGYLQFSPLLNDAAN